MAEKTQKIFEGKVVSTKMAKTAVVEVERFMRHAKYGKFIKHTKRFKVHDPEGLAKEGAVVSFTPCRPVSKDKHFKLVSAVK